MHHRVFAPDLPGYRLSDKPDIQYTTDLYVHHLSFINELVYRYVGASRDLVRWQLVASGVVHTTKRLSPRLIDQVYQHARLPSRGKAYTSWQQSEFLWDGPRTYLVDKLHEITVPTLIVNGEKDRAIPLVYAQEAHERITGSQICVLKDCGHWSQREMPEEFNRVVGNFLDP